jgi:hypothetical protein
MEIRENDKIYIIAPLSAKIDRRKAERLIKEIDQESRLVALDLSNVEECSIDFIEAIKNLVNKNLSIFNIQSDIFVLFNFMNVDKMAKLFVSENDFLQDTRQLINRSFKLV